jgi:hypothetical protein
MGAGDDVFVWNPGRRQRHDRWPGRQTTRCGSTAANIAENIDSLVRTANHARFLRDVANVTMDLDNVETIDFNAFGGADRIVVNDLSGPT